MNDAVYTPAQASAVADLPLKALHKLIDGRLIRQAGKPTWGLNLLLSVEALCPSGGPDWRCSLG